MNRLPLILCILATMGAITAGALFYVSNGKLRESQEQLVQAQEIGSTTLAQLSTANEKLRALEDQLKKERKALADSDHALEGVRSELYTARQEVSRSQQQLTEANLRVDALESTARLLRADLIQAERGLATEDNLSEINALRDHIARLETEKSELREKLDDPIHKAAWEIAPTPADGEPSLPSRAAPGSANPSNAVGTRTTIKSISAENGLIVLDSNPDLGLRHGQTITLVQNLKAIGKVRIFKVDDTFVVANILPGANAQTLLAGSTVSLLR